MSVRETGTIDAMAENEDELVLLIIDQVTWAMAQTEHLSLLQKKLNSYIRFIDSMGWRRQFGDRAFSSFLIQIEFRYQYPEYIKDFINSADGELKKRNLRIEYNVRSRE